MSSTTDKCKKCNFGLITPDEFDVGVCLDCQGFHRLGYGTPEQVEAADLNEEWLREFGEKEGIDEP